MLSLSDPLFASFAFYATADVVKMMSMSLLTAAKRIGNRVSDVCKISKGRFYVIKQIAGEKIKL